MGLNQDSCHLTDCWQKQSVATGNYQLCTLKLSLLMKKNKRNKLITKICRNEEENILHAGEEIAEILEVSRL